jgi:hypothetical protein
MHHSTPNEKSRATNTIKLSCLCVASLLFVASH